MCSVSVEENVCRQEDMESGDRGQDPSRVVVRRRIYRGDNYFMVMSMYLAVIARVLLISFETFNESLIATAQLARDTQQNVLNNVLDVWIDKMSCVSQPEKRKLLGKIIICRLCY